jgi:hypothetical protein
MNPEFQRQLWLRLSFSRLVGMPLMIGLAALAFYVLSNGSLNAVGGLGAVGFVLMVAGLGIQHAASSVVDEVQEKTWDQQRLCAMQPWSMTWGKWLGSTLMAWYGGLLCWIVAVACALHFGVPTAQIVWLSVLGVLLGIGAQTLGLTFNLVAAESGSIRQGRVATWLGLLLILPWLLRLGDWSLYANASMQWGGLTMSVLVFLLASATLACVCTVVAAWRSMARALSVRQWPWGWPMLVLVLSVYMAGFMPELNWQVFTVMGFIVAVGMTYLALLQERVSLPTWRRLVADARLGDWPAAIQSVPLWPTSLLLAILFVVPWPWVGMQPELKFLQTSLPVLLLLLVRDCLAALCIGFTVRARSATGVFLLYLVVIWLLLPLIVGGEATRSARVLVLPIFESTWVALIVALVQAGVAAMALIKVVRQKALLASRG